METSGVVFLLFTVFSGLRIFSYIPQIHRIAHDANGASAISYMTWASWTGANVSTALYAINNLGDSYLAAVSTIYAVCCLSVIVLTIVKRRDYATRARPPVGSAATTAAAVDGLACRAQPDPFGKRMVEPVARGHTLVDVTR